MFFSKKLSFKNLLFNINCNFWPKLATVKWWGLYPSKKKILLHFLTKKLSKYYEKMCKLFLSDDQMTSFFIFYTAQCHAPIQTGKIDEFINLKCFTFQKKICSIHTFESHHRIQRGRKQILDGGTQVNTRKLFLQNYCSFSNFYSIKHPKDGGA